jgi:hypothetical protein
MTVSELLINAFNDVLLGPMDETTHELIRSHLLDELQDRMDQLNVTAGPSLPRPADVP